MEKPNLKIATAGKRFLALFIDAFLAFILSSILFTFVTGKFMFKAIGGQDAQNTAFKYAYESGLFDNKPDENGDYLYSNLSLYEYTPKKSADQDKYGYEYYLDMLWDYYTDFAPNKLVDKIDGVSSVEEGQTYFYSNVLGMSSPDLTKVYASQEEVETFGNDLLTYTLGDSLTIDLSKKPSTVKAVTDENAETYKNYFLSTANNQYSGKYYDAAYSLSQSKHFNELSNALTKYNWICYATAFIPVQLIIFYVIPVALKNNKTIGKLIGGISVVDSNGVKLSKAIRFTRPLVLFVAGMTMLLPLTRIFDIFAWIILVAADYMVNVFKHEDKMGHDYLFKTIVIENKGSTVFSSKEEYNKYIEENPVVEEEKTIYDHSDVKLTVEDEETNGK